MDETAKTFWLSGGSGRAMVMSTVQPVLSKHLRDTYNQEVLASDRCFIQVHFSAFACWGRWTHACLIQVACLKEVATKSGLQ